MWGPNASSAGVEKPCSIGWLIVEIRGISHRKWPFRELKHTEAEIKEPCTNSKEKQKMARKNILHIEEVRSNLWRIGMYEKNE